MLRDVLMRLKSDLPEVDAFATSKSNICARCWDTPWDKDWSKPSLIWANPRISDVYKVLQKTREDGAKVILILPDDPCREFQDDASLWTLVQEYYYYGPDWKMYEDDIQWGTWALLLDGKQLEAKFRPEDVRRIRVTRTSKRNARKKKGKQAR